MYPMIAGARPHMCRGRAHKGERLSAIILLRKDARDDVAGRVGADMIVAVVDEGSEASALRKVSPTCVR